MEQASSFCFSSHHRRHPTASASAYQDPNASMVQQMSLVVMAMMMMMMLLLAAAMTLRGATTVFGKTHTQLAQMAMLVTLTTPPLEIITMVAQL
jgi:hypothetical protein